MPGLRRDGEAGSLLEGFLSVLADAEKEKKLTELTRALAGGSPAGPLRSTLAPRVVALSTCGVCESLPLALQVSTSGFRRPTTRR
jgi:hypothetical protein